MFTGIIQAQGEALARNTEGGEARFRIRALGGMPGITTGESIAVNGACLTVELHDPGGAWHVCYASEETLRLTTLSDLKPGGRVNLERALAVGDRLGGHLVSGHVDGVAVVRSIAPAGQSRTIELSFPPELGPGVVVKGSVALDGVSLTVNACGADFLRVNVIPETWKSTTLSAWKPGSRVNMETDMIGKYVARFLAPWQESARGGLTMEFLREHGF